MQRGSRCRLLRGRGSDSHCRDRGPPLYAGGGCAAFVSTPFALQINPLLIHYLRNPQLVRDVMKTLGEEDRDLRNYDETLAKRVSDAAALLLDRLSQPDESGAKVRGATT